MRIVRDFQLRLDTLVLARTQFQILVEILESEVRNSQLIVAGGHVGDGEIALHVGGDRHPCGLQLNLRTLQYRPCNIRDSSGEDAFGCLLLCASGNRSDSRDRSRNHYHLEN